jgi:hypothetical protein
MLAHMSNRAYLTATDHERIYPSFGDLPFDAEHGFALACDGCVPLLWIALFSAEDLRSHRFRLGKSAKPLDAVAPLCARERAIGRLTERGAFLDELFEENGGLGVFTQALSRELGRVGGKFVSIEYEEIAALGEPAEFDAQVRDTLVKLDARDASCKAGLLELSTVIDDRPFAAPEAAANSDEREDRWNVFRILGGGWIRPVEWDGVSPNAELQRTMARSRRRDAFGLYEP